MESSRFNVDEPLFSGKKIGETIILSFKEKPLTHVMDLSAKKSLHHYLDLVDRSDEIQTLILKESPTKMRRSEYIAFYRNIIGAGFDQIQLERMYNAIGQVILKLVDLNKMVVHVDSGEVIFLFMNIGLACDYRIVADNTIFQNPYFELDVVPKGGGVYFLSKMLGTATASKLLLSEKDIDAVQAHQLGIVDDVVPFEELDQMALAAAQRFSRLPSKYSIGIKKLLNYDKKDLCTYLAFEHELLGRQIHSCNLHNFGRLNEKL